jgi:hypothetical protein
MAKLVIPLFTELLKTSRKKLEVCPQPKFHGAR